MEELLKTFTLPDNTTMEEHSIVVSGDVIIGNHTDLGFGIIADSIIAGERVKISGNVIGKEEVRIDMWSHIGGDVRAKQEAYIGEFVNIDGKLVVEGDLDIGKDVKIMGGFEARGWIVVRNPIPAILYVFLYLTELLRLGKDEEVEKAMEELFSDDSFDLDEECLLIIPSGSKIDLESIRVPDKAVIGSSCRLMGNIRASAVTMNHNNTLFGSIKTENGIVVGEGNTIHGDLVSRGEVLVHRGTHVLGEINGGKIFVHEEARVDGAMRAPGGVIISRELIKEETKVGGILDMVPEPSTVKVGAKKKPAMKSVTAKTLTASTKTFSASKTAKQSAKKPVAAKSGAKSDVSSPAYEIPKKRMITAIRLSEVEARKKPVAKKKITAKKTSTKNKSTKKKTAAKKPAVRKI